MQKIVVKIMKYTAGKIKKIKETLEQVWDNDQRYRSSFNSEKLLKKYGENSKKVKTKIFTSYRTSC